MRAVIQRVMNAGVTINGEVHSEINKGLLVFIGIEDADSDEDIDYFGSGSRTVRMSITITEPVCCRCNVCPYFQHACVRLEERTKDWMLLLAYKGNCFYAKVYD